MRSMGFSILETKHYYVSPKASKRIQPCKMNGRQLTDSTELSAEIGVSTDGLTAGICERWPCPDALTGWPAERVVGDPRRWVTL